MCKLLNGLPFHWLHCPKYPPPPPSDGYHQTFSNLTGATQAADYLTYGLVDTIAGEFPSSFLLHDIEMDCRLQGHVQQRHWMQFR